MIFEELELIPQQVMASRAIGLQDMRLLYHRSAYEAELVATLEACVLTENAGPVEKSFVEPDVANFPWYIPRWLRVRWTKAERYTLRVTPQYIYPEANVKIPALGKAVKFNLVRFE